MRATLRIIAKNFQITFSSHYSSTLLLSPPPKMSVMNGDVIFNVLSRLDSKAKFTMGANVSKKFKKLLFDFVI